MRHGPVTKSYRKSNFGGLGSGSIMGQSLTQVKTRTGAFKQAS